jgi:hypothetical protein
MAIELLIDGAAEAVVTQAELLDESPCDAVHDPPHHEINEVFQPGIRQHRDVLDDAQRLNAPPRFDFVLHVIEQGGTLAVAARQEQHLVGLRRLVDVGKARLADVEIESRKVTLVVVQFLRTENEFENTPSRLLDENGTLA